MCAALLSGWRGGPVQVLTGGLALPEGTSERQNHGISKDRTIASNPLQPADPRRLPFSRCGKLSNTLSIVKYKSRAGITERIARAAKLHVSRSQAHSHALQGAWCLGRLIRDKRGDAQYSTCAKVVLLNPINAHRGMPFLTRSIQRLSVFE